MTVEDDEELEECDYCHGVVPYREFAGHLANEHCIANATHGTTSV